MLVEFMLTLEEMESKPPQTNIVEVGGLTIIGASDEEANLLEQLLEVRGQPGWQNPPEIAE